MSGSDVVISGFGMVTSLGSSVAENASGIKERRTGLRAFEEDGIPPSLRTRGEAPDIEPTEGLHPRLAPHAKFLNRGSMLGLAATREAVQNAAIDLEAIPPERKSAVIGAGDMSKLAYTDFYPAFVEATGGDLSDPVDTAALNKASFGGVNPLFLLESLNNNLFSFLTAAFELRGSGTSIAAQSPAGAQALSLAWHTIREERSDVALAVGYGSWINPLALYEMHGLGLLSKCLAGEASYRPMDRRRDGFIAGEGGACLVLERRDSAEARGHRPLARLASAADAHQPAERSGLGIPREAIVRAASLAMEEAGVGIEHLGFISPHGSGTRKGDRAEMAAMAELLGDRAPSVPICCLKPYAGHMAACSDIGEVGLSALALRERFAPATLNFDRAEEPFSALSLSSEHRPAPGRAVLSISYGLGGQASALVAMAE